MVQLSCDNNNNNNNGTTNTNTTTTKDDVPPPPPPSTPLSTPTIGKRRSILKRSSESSICSPTSTLRKRISLSAVTIVNTRHLPSYSTERFYMLSEIEMNSHSIIFLDDFIQNNDCDDTVETAIESETSTTPTLSPYVILYLLWKQPQEETTTNSSSMLKKTIQKSLEQIDESLPGSKTYLVIDYYPATTDDDNEEKQEDIGENSSSPVMNELMVQQSEQLAKQISVEMRDKIQGVSIGVSNHSRVAPGLEACMQAVHYGASDRRKLKQQPSKSEDKNNKSLICLVTQSPHILLGAQRPQQEQQQNQENENDEEELLASIQQQDADAVQGIQQALTTAEWNGNGTIESFAGRVHLVWCNTFGIQPESPYPRRRSSFLKRRYYTALDDALTLGDPLPFIIFAVIIVFIGMHMATTYEHSLSHFLSRWDTAILDASPDEL